MTDEAHEERPKTESRTERGASRANRWCMAGTISLVAWSCLRFPQSTLNTTLDSSWAAVLLFAREKGWQFGRDIVCTYGPLGFLSIEWFSPSVAVTRILFELLLGIAIAAGVCLAAWRLTLPWRLTVIGFFVVFASTERWGGNALFLDLGIFLWGWLCFWERGPRRYVYAAILAGLAATAALIKFNFLLLAIFTIGVLACDFALRRQFAVAAGLVAGFTAAFVAGWCSLGQSLLNLWVYFATSLDVADGYNLSMGSSSVDPGWLLLMTVSALAVMMFRIGGASATARSEAWRHGTTLLWFSGLLFTEWKYGCVRSDWAHAALAAGTIPVMAVCAQAIPTAKKLTAFASGTAAFVCVATPLLFMQSQIDGPVLLGHARQAFQNMAGSFRVLTRQTSYRREKTDQFESEKEREQLPWIRATVKGATVDVFGQSQTIAVFNEFNYRPRPVFQSYAAYSAETMLLNERFYQGAAAPEYVIFKLESLDERLPELGDARALRELLANYELAGSERDYWLLRKKGTVVSRMTPLKEGVLSAGEKLALQPFSDPNLWLEIELRQTLYGRLMEFFYKPPQTALVIWTQADPKAAIEYQAPAAMLSAGFLAKPVILRNKDVADILSGANCAGLEALAIKPGQGLLPAWQPEIRFRIYRIER